MGIPPFTRGVLNLDLQSGVNDFLSQLSAHLKPVNPIEPKGAELVRAIAETPHANPAKYAYEQLEKLIKEFESGLDDDHEVGLKIVSLGDVGVYYVQELDYRPPHILIFRCQSPEGTKATLIQHHSQLSFLLISLPKLEPQRTARRVGFAVQGDET